MWSICTKEIAQFFGNLSGYIAVCLFFLVTGLFLFFLSDSNILDGGYANLDSFFTLAPWIFMFMIPAVCMRVFSDEYRSGTFELLKTKPLTAGNISVGKYLAVLIIILIILLPTTIYIFTINHLSANAGIDAGGIAGSYVGLFFLAACFAAVSLCCGSFTGNAIVAFLLSSFVCLVLYFGFNAISRMPFLQGNADYYTEMLGIDFHYQSLSRGVIDSRDIIYFLSVIALALGITIHNIERRTV